MAGAAHESTPTPTTKETGDKRASAPPSSGASSRVQMLRTATYDEGAAALMPPADPVQRKAAVQRKAPPMEHAGPGTGPPGEYGQAANAGYEQPPDPVKSAEGPVKAGDLKVTADPLTLDGDEYRFRFLNPVVNNCLEHLITVWAGEDLETNVNYHSGKDPQWCASLRYKVLQSQEKGKEGEGGLNAELAQAMIAAVEKDPPIRDKDDPRLNPTYKKIYEEAEKRMGTARVAPLSKAEKDKGRVDLFESAGGGRVAGTGTSCGLLPGAVMKAGGVMPNLQGKGVAALTGSAVGGMRLEAEKIGAWHKAGKTDIPPPGAPYMLSSDSAGNKVEHVGVIRETDVPDAEHGLVWKTMDAGQGGDGYFADFVTRKVERRGDGVWLINTLKGQLGDPTKWRKLVGWVDIDKVMSVQAAQIAQAEADKQKKGQKGGAAPKPT